MVETRNSTPKRKPGRPPLPIQAGKKAKQGKKKGSVKKAPAAVAAAAKQAVAEVDGQVYVKAEPEVAPGGNYTHEEDLSLCKAWVSVSTDPIVGANQKGEMFWKAVHKKMYILYQEDAEVVVMNKRSWESVKNRFQKTLHPTVQKFNSYYKQAVEKNESGWTKEMYLEAAMKVWLQMEGKPYKFQIITRVLHQVLKFNPMIDETEDEDQKPKASATGKVMGSNMERPIGSKKAKQQRAIDSIEQGSMASTQAMEAMAKSSATMASIMAKRQRHDSWSKRAELYMKMGNEAKAMEMMELMEKDDKEDKKPAAAAAAAAIPKDITIDHDNDSSSEEVVQQQTTFKSAVDDALDSGDDQTSKHSSQPSDDSALVKRVPV